MAKLWECAASSSTVKTYASRCRPRNMASYFRGEYLSRMK
nr:MAG TPA: hypothetical protein [Caudoviricetes sp.]